MKGISFACLSLIAMACSNSGDSPYVQGPAESTILVYAVATNSLSSNLVYDKNEMLQAAQNIDVNKNNILVFETKYGVSTSGDRVAQISLLKLVKNNDTYGWETVKEYDPNFLPLNPASVTEVINYVAQNFKADKYGLVFWSHSTGSQPYVVTKSSDIALYSFGQDLTASVKDYVQINVNELAAAVPSGMFDYIWFDSCYMSNIESIYEFRDKCNTYVAYPTEVLEYGLPYNLVLPYMVGRKPDLVKAAETFFEYYAGSIATVAVMDMNNLNSFAESCGDIFAPDYDYYTGSFIRYTRNGAGPFYDLGDYAKAMAEDTIGGLSEEEWNDLLDQFVLYKAATNRDFSNNIIDQKRYSGISAHVFSSTDTSSNEQFYKSLGWYNRVF